MKTLRKDPFLKEAESFIEIGRLIQKNPEKYLGIDQFKDGSRLPHPDRSALVRNLMAAPLFIDSSAKEISDFLRMTASEQDFYLWHLKTSTDYSFSPSIAKVIRKSDQAASGTFMGNSMSYMLSFKSACTKVPVFQIEDRLLSLLDQSDIGDDLTVSFLENLPFGMLYVEMGAERALEYEVFNTETGMHRLEGFYVLKSDIPPNPNTGSTITFVFVGEPKANILDDATQMIMLETGDGFSDKTLNESIDLALDKCTEVPSRVVTNRVLFDHTRPLLQKLMSLAAKCVLYLNHGKYEQVPVNDRTAHLKSVAAITNPSKREKAIRSGYKLSDRIVIRHQDYPEGTPSSSDLTANGGVSAHWRRGHFRNQRYGEKLGLVKPVWIAPTLVGREKVADVERIVAPKNYVIKGPGI
mgnify:CR=1 FL=1